MKEGREKRSDEGLERGEEGCLCSVATLREEGERLTEREEIILLEV